MSSAELLLAGIDKAKVKMRRSARAIEGLGCDQKCHPARRRWFRQEGVLHTDQCQARTRIVEAIRTYVGLLGDEALGEHAQAAIDGELERYRATLRS